MAIDPKHIIKVSGRDFVTFEGLLDLAHQQGLKLVSTEIRQIPTADNGEMAVVHALVEMEDGRRFSGTGDASPRNVGKMISMHCLRMAETRAVARALRMATNVGITAFEELGGDEDNAPAPVTPLREAQQPASQAASGEKLITEKQLNYLTALLKDQGEGAVQRLQAKYNKPLKEFTRAEARQWIEKLSGKTG